MNYSLKISDFLSNIADAFGGSYNHENESLDKVRNEVLDISIIPNAGDDKKALKNDFDTFLKDTQKAHKSIKRDMKNGKTAS